MRRLIAERRRLCFDPDVVSSLALRLRERRILILTGESATGKTSLALLVASFLGPLADVSFQDAALCRFLPGKLCVDLGSLTGKEKDFHKRVLILKNPFANSNEDLLRFANQLSASQLDSYVLQLRDSQSFLLLTADTQSLPAPERLKGLGIVEEVPRPSPRELMEGLQQLVRQMEDEQRICEADNLTQKIALLLDESGPLLTAELGSMPRLARFVREHLIEVVRGTLALEDAMKRTTELGPWLLEDLPADPEAWCTVVALTLCSADRSIQGIPWFKFDLLRRALFRYLGRELHPELRRREIHDLCRSTQVLRRARTEVVTAPFPEPDMIRFLDERQPDLLWCALLGPGKGVATGLLPLLLRLTSDEDPYLRECAAQALGRLGQIDPFYITYRLMDEWTSQATTRRNALDHGNLLGHLFEGIRSAREDVQYQQECLHILRWSARNASSRTVQIVLFSLHRIATLDRECFLLTLDILKEVAEKRLKVRWQALHGITEKFRTREELARLVEHVFELRGGIDEVRRKAEQALQAIAVTEPGVLEAYRFILARLFFWPRFQGETLSRLLGWIHADPEHFGPLTAFLFLGRGGIAHWLERTTSLGHVSGSAGVGEGSLLLESIQQDEELASVLHGFVESLFIHLKAFPGLLREALERGFLRLLATWAREARSIERLHDPVADLLARLFSSRDEELSERILRLAQEPAASPELEDLRALAIAAITGQRRRCQPEESTR
jgi:hypothetical protein